MSQPIGIKESCCIFDGITAKLPIVCHVRAKFFTLISCWGQCRKWDFEPNIANLSWPLLFESRLALNRPNTQNKFFLRLNTVHICPALNANEIQTPLCQAPQSVLIGEKSSKHTKFCWIRRNMEMPNNPAKYEALIKQYLRSIPDISVEARLALSKD